MFQAVVRNGGVTDQGPCALLSAAEGWVSVQVDGEFDYVLLSNQSLVLPGNRVTATVSALRLFVLLLWLEPVLSSA